MYDTIMHTNLSPSPVHCSHRRMLRLTILFLSLCCTVRSFLGLQGRVGSNSVLTAIQRAPYEDIIPFLSEHVQPSDQLLFVGAKTDLCIQMAKNGYGGLSRHIFLHCVILRWVLEYWLRFSLIFQMNRCENGDHAGGSLRSWGDRGMQISCFEVVE